MRVLPCTCPSSRRCDTAPRSSVSPWSREAAHSGETQRGGLEPSFSVLLRFQLTAGLAQKQLVERLKMPSIRFTFLLFPEASRGPTGQQCVSPRGVSIGWQAHSSIAHRCAPLCLLDGRWSGRVPTVDTRLLRRASSRCWLWRRVRVFR